MQHLQAAVTMMRPALAVLDVQIQSQCPGSLLQHDFVGNDDDFRRDRMMGEHDAEVGADAGRFSGGDGDAGQVGFQCVFPAC